MNGVLASVLCITSHQLLMEQRYPLAKGIEASLTARCGGPGLARTGKEFQAIRSKTAEKVEIPKSNR